MGHPVGLLVESLVVIVSILVAFGLDAWWGERQLRQDLLDSMAGVTEEIQANAAALVADLNTALELIEAEFARGV